MEQQDLQALHRVRERLMGARTAVNARRGLLAESGIVWPTGIHTFRNVLAEKLEAEQGQRTPQSPAARSGPVAT